MGDYQNGYTAIPAAAYPGLNLSGDFENIFSRQIETAAVGFGLAVGQGTADTGVKIGGTGFVGITVADKTQVDGTYDIGVAAGILNKGYIWVVVDSAVTPASVPTFTTATGAVGDTAVGVGVVAIPNATYLNSAALGGLALLFIG